jgi:EAL domain-containing protein (putative c-di-GMP-specific phosphodiesterase class I)
MRKLTSRVAQNEQHAPRTEILVRARISPQRRETILQRDARPRGDDPESLEEVRDPAQQRAQPGGRADSRSDGASILDAVKEALRENRVDLHLQAIVNLPQRRTCFYEGFTRLRRADGQRDHAGGIPRGGRAGQPAGRDRQHAAVPLRADRAASVGARPRIGVFCNISMASLEDEQFFTNLPRLHAREPRHGVCDDLRDQRARSSSQRSDTAARNMLRLKELGFRFSLDKGDGLNFDLPQLQAAGVRFLKVNVERLLEELTPGGERPISSITRDIAPKMCRRVRALWHRPDRREDGDREVRHREFSSSRSRIGQGHVFGRRGRSRVRCRTKRRRRRTSSVAFPPPRCRARSARFLKSLSEFAGDYDAILCDVWGVIHNGRESFARRLRCAEEIPRDAWAGGPDHQCARAKGACDADCFRSFGVPMDCFDDVRRFGDATRNELKRLAPGPVYPIGLDGDDFGLCGDLGSS